jgi:hypothetical protein
VTLLGVTPTRVLDTRNSTGGHQGTLGQGETFTLQVLGRGAVPTFGVDAVQLNVTVLGNGPANGGYLTFWPSGRPRPTASNINHAVTNPIAT